jgi:hypothetical protein
VIDGFAYELLKHQFSHLPAPPAPIERDLRHSPVQFGAAVGVRFTLVQVKPAPWKQVDYLLQVPGGFVSVRLCAMGADLDEHELEAKLETLRVVPAPE